MIGDPSSDGHAAADNGNNCDHRERNYTKPGEG